MNKSHGQQPLKQKATANNHNNNNHNNNRKLVFSVGWLISLPLFPAVKEETGVDTEFVGVVCFRHMHNFRYGCSDFYFVCHLRPLTREIKIDESEIADCRWMKVKG